MDNIERSIHRSKKRSLGHIPKNFNDLSKCFEEEKWKDLLKLNIEDSLRLECITKNGQTKAIIFIDEALKTSIAEKENITTIFVDGTFATVPRVENTNCQLWTILIKHDKRVNKITFCDIYIH